MIAYKGFEIPETFEEAAAIASKLPPCPIGPHLVVKNHANVRITTGIPLEELANHTVDMVAVVHEVERIIDHYIKEREERCSTESTTSTS